MSDPVGIGVIALGGAILIVAGVALAWALDKRASRRPRVPDWSADQDGAPWP